MEAAWKGDIEVIKSLTLQAWGPDLDQPPLKMAITDRQNNTPFGLAFFRGHYNVAEAILEIVKAQWSPKENDKVRYRMTTEADEDEDEYSDEDSGDDSEAVSEEPRIVTEKVDKKFTIDDIGHVSMKVNSSIKPLTLIYQHSGVGEGTLFHYCLKNDNLEGLKLLIELGQRWASHKFGDSSEDEEESTNSFTFPEGDLQWAIRNGRTDMLSLVIKRTGAGIPLDHLVKKSGVELQKKPRFYQGLTVYGKKRFVSLFKGLYIIPDADYRYRKDWANAGRNMVVKTSGMRTPPLLFAALGGSIESVEFFLSDAPHRLYAEFGKSKTAQGDSRLSHLKESPGGFDRAIARWLGADGKSSGPLS